MIHRIEVWASAGHGDPHAEGVCAQVRELGVEGVSAVRSARLFFVQGQLDDAQRDRLATELLADPVTERFVAGVSEPDDGAPLVEVHLQPGVMDPVARSAQKAAVDMGLPVETITTGRRYEFVGALDQSQRELIARRLLANAVIEDVHFKPYTPPERMSEAYQLDIRRVDIRDLDAAALQKLSDNGDLFLNLAEMQAIQNYFRDQQREPTDVELEMLAQTWSEHCGHKTLRSDVEVYDKSGKLVEKIPNLLKNTIFKSTVDLDKPWCINVFEDNAGVVEFDENHAVCFKVETHNHPSAIEPYGGAATGIGGVVRDPMGTGLGAEPVANTDVFCFAPTDTPLEDLPTGVLHPKRIMRGVVGGVRDYGNRMGIPTVNGALYFDEKYLGNPLVFCGTLGLLPAGKGVKQWPNDGDAIVVVGGRTGRDGIHGATFSSGEMTHAHETEFSHAVQIGNAITEKKVLDTIVQARDAELFSAITDCGAGGLSSAIGEMGEKIGAEVHLEDVPLKYDGLSYSEIWISEAQERMVLSVPPANVERILALFGAEDVEATVLGHYGTPDHKLRLHYAGEVVGELDMKFLHDGLPRPTKRAEWQFEPKATTAPLEKADYTDALKQILAAPNVASKEWVVRQYDHEVQGGSVIKPFVGVEHDGPGDAAVVRPVLGSPKAVALSVGMNPALGELDPYQSALHAVDEALRNLVAVGGDLATTALMDNFCWGNCNKPDRMGALVQAAKACYDAAMTYSTPFVSGKDSLNNEFQTDTGETIAIPPTLLISAFSVIEDASRCVTADAKAAGNLVLQVGYSSPLLGGSHYLKVHDLPTGNDVPPVNIKANRRTMVAVQTAIAEGTVRACHDLSEGGLAVAAAEMAFSGALGMTLDLSAVPVGKAGFEGLSYINTAALLFGEAAGRFLVEIEPEQLDAFVKCMGDVPFGEVGKVTNDGKLVVHALNGNAVIDADVAELKAAWQGTFAW